MSIFISVSDIPRAIYFLSSIFVIAITIVVIELLQSGFRSLAKQYGAVFRSYTRWVIRRPRSPSSLSNNYGRLCYQCENVIASSRLLFGSALYFIPQVEYHDHHTSITELTHSKDVLCHLCALLLNSVDHAKCEEMLALDSVKQAQLREPVELPQQLWDRLPYFLDRFVFQLRARYLLRKQTEDDRKLQIKLSRPKTNTQILNLQLVQNAQAVSHQGSIFEDTAVPDCMNRQAQLTFKSPSTSSENHIRLAMKWLQTCLSSHERCQRYNQTMTLPSRLIRIKAEASSLKVCLHLVDQADRDLKYLTLSHRWGGSKPVSLSQANLEQFQSMIPWDDLPKTFQDACFITQRLGFEFIWIDSLCIVQDSSADWAKESRMMGDIYAGSVCTIAATGSTNSDDGCFMDRDIQPYVDCNLISTSGGTVFRACMCDVLETSFDNQVNAAPLNARAWVFQERLLSTRILHYSSKMIFWECQSCTVGESHPESPVIRNFEESVHQVLSRSLTGHGSTNAKVGQTQSLDFSKVSDVLSPTTQVLSSVMEDYRSAFDFLRSSQTLNNRSQAHVFSRCWYQLVGKYTLGALTKPGDKLVAINGIAARIEKSTGMTYCAGLWRECLLYNLLWSVESPAKHRPVVTRAPSWSWASVDGMVKYQQEDDMYRITSRATIVSVDVDRDATSLDLSKSSIELKGFFYNLGVINTVENDIQTGISYPLRDEDGHDFGRCFPDVLNETRLKKVSVVELFRTSATRIGSKKMTGRALGLVLTDCPGTNAFRRIGYFSRFLASKSTDSSLIPKWYQARTIKIV